ncbi:MAG: tetratricopeptide repeat protein, partial [Flavisolibacter sp.]|nr:tetratricopeptide repeat protein [Flavisolibacter sp.]
MRKFSLFFSLLVFLFSAICSKAQDTALLRLRKMQDDTVKVSSLITYGRTYNRTEPEKAIAIYNEALGIAQKIKDENGVAGAMLGLGFVNLSTGKYEAAIQQYQTAAHIFQKLLNIKEMCNAQLDLSACFTATGQRDSAFYYCMSALKILETQPYIRERTRANLNIGTLYNNLKSYDNAIAYQNKALALALPAKDTPMILNTYSALSLSYENKEDKQQAYDMVRKALQYLTPGSNKFSACRTYDQYAFACVGVGKYDAAIEAAQKSISLAKEVNDINHYGSATITLAKAYAGKGDHKKAIALLNKLSLFSKEAHSAVKEDSYEVLAESYFQIADYKNAAEAYSKLLPLKDSSFKSETNEMIAEQEVSYQTAQKEKQLSENKLQLAEKNLQLQKNRYYMYYTLAALVVALLIVAILFIRSRHKKRMHEQELKSIHQQKELQLLQALMQGEEKERSRIAKDLHDGVAGMLAAVKMHFSSLPGADNLIQSEGYQQGMQLLNEATQEIRKTSHNLMPEVLLQHGLDEAIHRYCNNVNNSKVLQIQYDSWGEISRFTDSFELSVYRIVQELVNNIIKHSKATQAIVQLSQQDDLLSISIEDNGVGFSNNDAGKDGMGLRSLQSRIKAMNGKMEVESSQQSGVS